jgi:hypothetical protein
MNKVFLIFALLFLIGCSEGSDPVPEQNNEENTESGDNNVFLVNGFICNIDFNEESYTIKVSKDNKFLFEVSEGIGKGTKLYIDFGYGNKKDIIASYVRIFSILQYENTYYLLADLRDESDILSFWGIRKLYSYENGKVHTVTLNTRSHLPTDMAFWFDNSIHVSENYSAYPEATASEGHVYDNELNLISKHIHYGRVLDLYHVIDVSGGEGIHTKDPLRIGWYDIRNSSHYIWQYMCDINNNEFVINSWDASYSPNNTILVTINITYITEEKEVLNFELDKNTGELITPNQITQ